MARKMMLVLIVMIFTGTSLFASTGFSFQVEEQTKMSILKIGDYSSLGKVTTLELKPNTYIKSGLGVGLIFGTSLYQKLHSFSTFTNISNTAEMYFGAGLSYNLKSFIYSFGLGIKVLSPEFDSENFYGMIFLKTGISYIMEIGTSSNLVFSIPLCCALSASASDFEAGVGFGFQAGSNREVRR